MLEQFRIVLVNTSHTGNIGSVARAMKTMGLNHLYLVDPVYPIDGKAIALAAGATDILATAITVTSLSEAIHDCGLVVGTSARDRTWSWPMLAPRSCAAKMLSEASNYPVALVFGRENNGLTNAELQQCHYHVCLPANPEYSSLNLAMAVQILCYEIHVAWLDNQQSITEVEQDYPLNQDIEDFYQHLEATLLKTGFIVKAHPGQVMMKLRRLFNRARLEKQEINIFRGILSSIQSKNQQPKNQQSKNEQSKNKQSKNRGKLDAKND